ncbi:MAG: DUF4422 domain-containing protein [Lachnospiraceae bacterium]
MDTKIFVMTHKKYEELSLEGYISLHVGREGKEDLGYLGDNTGDSISERNASFCELTGLYWVWKNQHCDIAGLAHYRRFLSENGQPLTKVCIEKYLENYDCILPYSFAIARSGKEESICAQYCRIHYPIDYHILRGEVKKQSPEYQPTFDFCMQRGMLSVGNMIITRKEILDAYCEWLFPILFEVEKKVDISDYDSYQKRIFGFMSERLLRVWLLHHNYRILETDFLLRE